MGTHLKRTSIFPGSTEKYADRIDWEELSCNGDIFWTIPMLEKFKSRLNWSQIARNMSEEKVSVDML